MPYPDGAIEVLHHIPGKKQGIGVVSDEVSWLHLHLALLDQDLDHDVQTETHFLLTQAEETLAQGVELSIILSA